MVKGVTERVITLLTFLQNVDSEISTTEISRGVELPVQTVHRLLGELAAGGLVHQNQKNKLWCLGPTVIGLGVAAKRQFSLISMLRPYLELITDRSRETTILTVKNGVYGTYIDMVESPEKIRLVESIGMRLPLTIGASRRAILAFLPPPEWKKTIMELSQAGCTFDEQELFDECTAIRNKGYALSIGQVTPGTVGITIPIVFNTDPVASITIGGPEYRLTPSVIDQMASFLLEVSRDISASIVK